MPTFQWKVSSILIYTFKFLFIKNALSFSASLAWQGSLFTGLKKGHIFRRWASRIWSKISWNLRRNVRFQILTTVYLDKAVLWDVALCSSVYQVRCFGGTCGLSAQGILIPGYNSLTIWPSPTYVLKDYSQPPISLKCDFYPPFHGAEAANRCNN
jgi:hypothetical protein